MMRILIINGPNLNLTGLRQPDIYGTTSFDTFLNALHQKFEAHELVYFQSNSEGELIDFLQQEIPVSDAVVINPGAYAHTSIALADALQSFAIPIVEVHLSNIYAREAFRAHSYVSAVAAGTISGLGLFGYEVAVRYLIDNFRKSTD